MAKIRKTTSFTKAVINKDDMTITEHTKDGSYVFDLNKILSDWDGIEKITLTIKQDDEIPADK